MLLFIHINIYEQNNRVGGVLQEFLVNFAFAPLVYGNLGCFAVKADFELICSNRTGKHIVN
jgi:hypothetical protein